MIGFAGAAVFMTLQYLNYYPEDRYCLGAMQLFASIALMFGTCCAC